MNYLRQLQDAVKARLIATPELAGVSVLVEDSKEIQSEIEKALGRIGLAVLVANPSWSALTDDDGRQTPDYLAAELEIGVGETPIVWRSVNGRPTCMDVADRISRTIHGHEPGIPFQPIKVVSVINSPGEDRQVYTVTIRTKFLLPD